MINKLNKIIGLIFFVGGLYLILRNNQDLPFYSVSLLAIMFIFSFVLVFLPILNSNLIQKLPLLSLINIFFLICYFGAFFSNKNKIFFENISHTEYVEAFSVQEYTYAINILFVGYLFFHIGYFLTYYFIKNFKRKNLDYLTCTNKEILVIGLLTLTSTIFFFYILNIQNYIGSLSQIKFPLLLFGTGLINHYLIYKKNINKFHFVILILLISTPITLELITGSLNFPFMIIFLLYIYYLVLKKRINLLPFFLICLIFLFVHLGKYEYRKLTWSTNLKEEPSFFNKSKIFFDVYFLNQSDELKIENLVKRKDNYRLERRIFHSLWSLLIVTTETPQNIPYWEGYSYRILSSKIIPRIFWENKPSDRLGNEFGHRYNAINPGDSETPRDNHTSWNMPVLNEFYVNYGPVGVIVGMMLIGTIVCLLSKMFSIKENNNIEGIIAFYIFVPLFFLESHLSLLFGAIIQSYIFLLIISFMLIYILRKIKW